MKKKLVILLAILLTFMSLAIGCSKDKPSTQTTGQTTKQTTTTKSANNSAATEATAESSISWTTPYDRLVTATVGRPEMGMKYPGENETYENNGYANWIRDTFNFELVVGNNGWLAAEGHEQKVTLAITSRDIPDVLQVNENQLSDIMDSGLIEDLTTYVEQYSSELLRDVIDASGGMNNFFFKAISNGKIWAINGAEPSYQDSLVWIRNDWLEKAGLKTPTNLDELLAVARKFKELDLAGDGLTVPIEIQRADWGFYGNYNTPVAVDPLFNNMQAHPRLWYMDDTGKYIYGSVQPSMKEPLSLLSEMYKEGLIARDFATRDHVASLAAGYSGITFGPWWSAGWPLNDCKNNDPEADWIPINCTLSSDGKYYSYRVNPTNRFFVVRKGFEHPEIVVKLLNISTEYNVNNAFNGAETLGYKRVIPDEIQQFYKGIAGIGNAAWPLEIMCTFPDAPLKNYENSVAMFENYLKGNTEGLTEQQIKNFGIRKDYFDGTDKSITAWSNAANYLGFKINYELSKNMHILNNVYPRPTKTMNTKWSDLQTLEITSILKIIRGEESISYFDYFVEQWNKQGGEQITKEINDVLK